MKPHIFKSTPKFIYELNFNRYLAGNYWYCPVTTYSTLPSDGQPNDDYLLTKSQCGKRKKIKLN